MICMTGSPPQVRGKHGFGDVWVRIPRITPAGAGKTFCGPSCSGRFQDHPRRCGENRYSVKFPIPSHGSPPQVRGKLGQCRRSVADAGITPAGAGKTLMIFKREVSSWDHPRRCGENRRIAGQLGQLRGSPPQVRGKPRIVFKKRRLKGITPAGAGKTFQQADKVLALEDHPRRCGENSARL